MAEVSLSFIQLFFRLLSRQTGQIGQVEYRPQKPHFKGEPIAQPFERATPESQGITSEHVREYLEALYNDPEASPHQVIVIRHAKIIAECSYAPYQHGMWHVTHSMCKTFTGMAVGLAIEDGLLSLDDKLDDIFPQYIKLLKRFNRKEITIRNLLTMTSEVSYSEAGAIDGTDWRTNFMSSSCKCEPGTKFDYNSMNSYMLSAAIQEKTGMTMFDYLRQRIFHPMGIEEIFWEESPQGITKGGWGCFIRPEDAGKLGQLFLNHGKWNGKQLISAKWLSEMSRTQVDNGQFGYGYQMWMEERPGGYAMNGLFGQDVVIYPDDDMILVVNCGNNELFQSGSLTEIMRRYWGISYHPSDEPLPENPEAHKALEECISQFGGLVEKPRPKHRWWWGLTAKSSDKMTPQEMLDVLKDHAFVMDHGKTGIFPLICQVMHNNFTDGIQKIGFDEIDGDMMILLYEGSDIHHIRVGFDGYKISEIVLHGEPYYIGTKGRIATDEYNRVTLLLNIAFIEEACSRQINLYFDGETVEMRASEKPGDRVIADAIAYTGDDPKLYSLPGIKQILEQGGMDFLDIAITATVHPQDRGHLEHGTLNAPAITKS